MPPTEALRRTADWLACPHCAGTLRLEGSALACPRGHAFDVARQGYVNLMGRSAPRNADTADMLTARAAFLDSGHYEPVQEALVGAVAGAERVLEAGAGTGWYLARVLEQLPQALGLATDVSVPAVRRAARAHPRAAAVVADTWDGLPVADGAVDAVLAVFAPRNPTEFARVLAPSGRLVVALPGPDHLVELRDTYGLLGVAGDKLATLRDSLGALFHSAGTVAVRRTLELSSAEATALVAMGPNAFHCAPADIDGGAVTLDVTVATFTTGHGS